MYQRFICITFIRIKSKNYSCKISVFYNYTLLKFHSCSYQSFFFFFLIILLYRMCTFMELVVSFVILCIMTINAFLFYSIINVFFMFFSLFMGLSTSFIPKMSLTHNRRIISLNVNSLGDPMKQSKIIAKLKRAKASVLFQQETHLTSLKSSFYSSCSR